VHRGVDEGSQGKTVSPLRQTTTMWRKHDSQLDGEKAKALLNSRSESRRWRTRRSTMTRQRGWCRWLLNGASVRGCRCSTACARETPRTYAARLRAGSRETTREAGSLAAPAGEHAGAEAPRHGASCARGWCMTPRRQDVGTPVKGN
jgi:hypothetical protein